MAGTLGTGTRMTLEEFLELTPPEDESVSYLLNDGELVQVTKPTFEHNEIAILLAFAILPHIQANALGRLSGDIIMILDPEDPTTYAPDLVFLAPEHKARLKNGRIWGAPDLVVEVLSPSTRADDQGRKFEAYHRHGIPWYWIVDPESLMIAEYRHTPEGYLRTQTILRGQDFRPGCFPGLSLNLAALRGS